MKILNFAFEINWPLASPWVLKAKWGRSFSSYLLGDNFSIFEKFWTPWIQNHNGASDLGHIHSLAQSSQATGQPPFFHQTDKEKRRYFSDEKRGISPQTLQCTVYFKKPFILVFIFSWKCLKNKKLNIIWKSIISTLCNFGVFHWKDLVQ